MFRLVLAICKPISHKFQLQYLACKAFYVFIVAQYCTMLLPVTKRAIYMI
jgi:hypothetical protein